MVDAPIGRSVTRRTRMAVRNEGKEARTVYEAEEWFGRPEAARLRCRLETGRTHQIRVHLSAIGHPHAVCITRATGLTLASALTSQI